MDPVLVSFHIRIEEQVLLPFSCDDDNNGELYEDILRQLLPGAWEAFTPTENPGNRPPSPEFHGAAAGSGRSTASHDDDERFNILSDELLKLLLQEDDETQVLQEETPDDPSDVENSEHRTQPLELSGLPCSELLAPVPLLDADIICQSDREISSVLQQEEWESLREGENGLPDNPLTLQALPDDGIRFLSDREITRVLQQEECESSGGLGNGGNLSGSRGESFIGNMRNSHSSDEEFSRQLQEEEWGAANNLPVGENSSSRGAASATAPTAEPPKCSICLVEFEDGDEKRYLPCTHEFHRACVDRWLQANTSCPVCRTDVNRTEVNRTGVNRADVNSDGLVREPACSIL